MPPRLRITFAIIVCLQVFGPATVWADVGPRIKIVVPKERATPAVSGQEYVGHLEIKAGAAGTINSVRAWGEGWTVTSVDPPGPVHVVRGQTVAVTFRAIPQDSTQFLHVLVELDGRPVTKRLDLSPARFARAGKPGRVVNVDAQGRAVPFHPIGSSQRSSKVAGQSLHLFGRIAYQRPTVPGDGTLITVGAESLWFEIMDDDSPDPFDDTIFSGYTDAYGYFDVHLNWDDCDITCDDPDIYIRWETDNDVVNVEHADLFEEDYSWSTADDPWNDFEGSEIDFGTLMPEDPAEHPALHIHNSIMHAYHYILLNSGTSIAVQEVDVQWPEDESGSGAYYDPSSAEIHIAPSRQWNEDTHTHEYGHHFLETYSVNTEPDYCNNDGNNGTCDTCSGCPGCSPCTFPFSVSCGHCQWCSETDHDAWNEGWPNWLADVVTRSYPIRYNGYQPFTARSQERIQPNCACCLNDGSCCSEDTQPNNPFTTEGYAGALCRDIEDNDFYCSMSFLDCTVNPGVCSAGETCNRTDDHDNLDYDGDGNADDYDGDGFPDCNTDALALGPSQIFQVVVMDKPSTIAGFISAFRARFPQFDQDLWSTVRNVAPEFSFPIPPPTVVSQTQGCQTYVEGDMLSLNAQGNGSLLRYQWRRDGVNSADSASVSGSTAPTLVINPVSAIDTGSYDCVVRTCDGTLSVTSAPIRVQVFAARGAGTNAAAFGRNDVGQLGNGLPPTAPPRLPPTPLAGLSGVVSISGGDFFGTALRSDGTVWAWGRGRSGELGATTGASATPVQVPGISDVIALSSNGATGFGHTLALRSDGTVWSWGYNGFGELGVAGGGGGMPVQVPALDCVTSIAAGSYHSIASRSDGTVWTWGYNGDGERGDGTIGGWGYELTQVNGLTNAAAVGAGGYHCLVLNTDGTVTAWGRNTEGQLGDGTFTTRGFPALVANMASARFVTAGVFHSLAILDDGTIRGWGDNAGGQLGTGDTVRATVPVAPFGAVQAVDIAGGAAHTIILGPNRTVWGCGRNTEGQLGLGILGKVMTVVPIAGLVNVGDVDAGDDQSFLLSPGVGPAIYQQPASRMVPGGAPVQFAVAALGSQPFTYQWSRGGNDLLEGDGIVGVHTATLTLNPTSGAMAGSYSVRVENLFGFATSSAATLTLNCVAGDIDCNGLVDAADVEAFVPCLGGPGNLDPPKGCAPAVFVAGDEDNDDDVDVQDFARFQVCFNGAALPNCADE